MHTVTPTTLLVAVLALSASVWIGGLVVIAVVARAARRTLEPAQQVAFFRALGRAYGPVGSLALLLALACGAVLTAHRPWDGLTTAATVTATALVVATVAGIAQARRMTRLRQAALHRADGVPLCGGHLDQIHRGARQAACLRAVIALLSLGLLGIAATLAT